MIMGHHKTLKIVRFLMPIAAPWIGSSLDWLVDIAAGLMCINAGVGSRPDPATPDPMATLSPTPASQRSKLGSQFDQLHNADCQMATESILA